MTPLITFLVSGLAAPISSAPLSVQPGPKTTRPSHATLPPLPPCWSET